MRSHRVSFHKATSLVTSGIFIAGFGLAGLLAAAAPVAAQDQTSLGDAARKVRTEKQSGAAPKTFTNENLPKTDAGISVVGQAPAASAAPATTPAPAAAPDDKTADKPAATPTPATATGAPPSVALLAIQHDLDDSLKQQDRLEKEIDLSQRDYSLQEQQALQNPRFNTDHDTQAHLAELKQGIADQKTELDNVKAHIADLQKKLDEMNKGAAPGSK
jgi:hypothetical protein